MKSLQMIFAGATMLLATAAFADRAPMPPPDFGDCTAAKQQKSATDTCQECNDPSQEGCEKQWKNQGYTQSCQIKPEFSGSWREVWCKSSAPTKETATPAAARIAPEATKAGGCAVAPEGRASWLWLLGLGFVVSRSRSKK